MKDDLVIKTLGQFEDAIRREDQYARERLLIAVLALLAPDAVLAAARRRLDAALGAVATEEERVAVQELLTETVAPSRNATVTQLRCEVEQLKIQAAGGDLLLEAVDEYIQAGRAPRDSIKFVSSSWHCFHAYVAAEVEMDDAARNPGAWSRESTAREEVWRSDADSSRAQKMRHLMESSQRRVADTGRRGASLRLWLCVFESLRAVAA